VVCYITGFPVFALLSGEAEKRHSEMGSARELYVRGWWEEGVRESGARGVLAGGCARTATPSRSCGALSVTQRAPQPATHRTGTWLIYLTDRMMQQFLCEGECSGRCALRLDRRLLHECRLLRTHRLLLIYMLFNIHVLLHAEPS
jgi:hypothetical protein